MSLVAPQWLLDRVVSIIGLVRPSFLERDSLKMCWVARPITLEPLAAGYSSRALGEPDDVPEWRNVLCASGMPVAARTWALEFGPGRNAVVHGIHHHGTLVATAATRDVRGCPSAAYLLWVGVDPAHQGRRLGRHIVTLAMSDVQRRGYSHLFLLTNDQRLPALALYADLGFKSCLASWDKTHHYRWRRVAKRLQKPLEFCRDIAHREPVARMVE